MAVGSLPCRRDSRTATPCRITAVALAIDQQSPAAHSIQAEGAAARGGDQLKLNSAKRKGRRPGASARWVSLVKL